MFEDDKVYDFLSNWNEVPALYAIYDSAMNLLYVGQTDNLKRRMDEHRRNRQHDMHRFGPRYVKVEVERNDLIRCARERALINVYDPPCNRC